MSGRTLAATGLVLLLLAVGTWIGMEVGGDKDRRRATAVGENGPDEPAPVPVEAPPARPVERPADRPVRPVAPPKPSGSLSRPKPPPVRPAGPAVGERVPRVTGTLVGRGSAPELSGELPFDSHVLDKPTVFLVVSTECRTTRRYAARFGRLERLFGPQGVDFVYAYPNKAEPPDGARVAFSQKRTPAWLLVNGAAELARGLGAQLSPEAWLVDRGGVLRYHGAIDSDPGDPANAIAYLARALEEHLDGRDVTTPEASAIGSALDY